jgi:hypothetical protein
MDTSLVKLWTPIIHYANGTLLLTYAFLMFKSDVIGIVAAVSNVMTLRGRGAK